MLLVLGIFDDEYKQWQHRHGLGGLAPKNVA